MIKPINLKKNIRKSGFEDMFFVMVCLIGMAFFFIILSKAWTEMKTPLNTGLTAALPAGSTYDINGTLNKVSGANGIYNNLFPFIFIGLLAFVMITAGFMMQHPIMIFVGIIVLGVAIILAVAYSNVYHQISQTDELKDETAKFPIVDIFMKYLPLIIFIVAILITITLLIRRGGGGSGGL
jgi:hypothetical protein